jgi:hypothetical protein
MNAAPSRVDGGLRIFFFVACWLLEHLLR